LLPQPREEIRWIKNLKIAGRSSRPRHCGSPKGHTGLKERPWAAASEFQKILDHPRLALNNIIRPLAHLGLGRARALSGDKPGAHKAYQDFFALWQHADPTLPILQQAKAEYTRPQ
jgi:hypothetical protein